MAEDPDSVCVLGSRVHLVTVRDTVDRMEGWVNARDGRCRRVVATGFHGLWSAYQEPRVHKALNSAELWAPDGIAPIWVARLRRWHGGGRAPGAEIMQEFLRRANARGYSSYFYGDTGSTLEALRRVLQKNYPGHRIAGTFSPPFRPLTPDEDNRIIDTINAARPDVLWVALGAPKQDVWIYERVKRLQVPVAIGVGAAFAFVAGTVERCPAWIGRMGFEWAYRLLKEPRKVWRRDFIDGPRFLLRLSLELSGLAKMNAPHRTFSEERGR